MSRRMRFAFSTSFVAAVALIAAVAGVVIGRAASSSSAAAGGGGDAPQSKVADARVDVIIKAANSSFWQSMLAGSKQAGSDFGIDVGLFGPPAETDIAEQVQLVENSISRGVDAIVVAANSSTALNNVIKRAQEQGIKVITVDNKVTTDTAGFIGTDNLKAGKQAGKRMCALLEKKGHTSGHLMIESSVAGVQVISTRDKGFKRGIQQFCPKFKITVQRYNKNDIPTGVGQVNNALTADSNIVGIFADNNKSGVAVARAIKDNNAKDEIPVVAFDTNAQEVAALRAGRIDAIVVQNPYFFGYQGVIEAAMASAGRTPPVELDPGVVIADRSNMNQPQVRRLLNPPKATTD